MSKCIKCGNLFINNPLDDEMCHICKIADLEAKLAESEEKLKAMETLREMVGEDSKLNFRRYIDTLEKNEQLEQQLAEKEKEIERLKYTVDFYKSYYISFKEKVVDELEKVKEFALELFRQFCQSTEYRSNQSLVGRRFIEYYPLNEYINNQIEELKKGSE